MKASASDSRVILALDVDDLPAVDDLIRASREWVSTYKVGARLFTAEGPRAVARILAAHARVFLDLKYHDIPNTVGEATRRAADAGVAMLTVHTAGGRAMLEAAVRGAGPETAVLGVTVLTSLDAEDLRAVGSEPDVELLVKRRAELALDAGCDGLVCSPREVAALRARFGDEPLLVTPGIRPSATEVADQKRAATPAQAIENGADHLVVGRAITQASDPSGALRSLLEGLP